MILAVLVGSHPGNIPVKFEAHWPKGSGGISFWSKLMTTQDDGHWLITIAHHEHFVLRWAKNARTKKKGFDLNLRMSAIILCTVYFFAFFLWTQATFADCRVFSYYNLNTCRKANIAKTIHSLLLTVNILNNGTDYSEQIARTQIRLLLKEQSDQGPLCLPFKQYLSEALLAVQFLRQLW